MDGNATPDKIWLAILRHYTLQELSKATCRFIEDGDHPWQFIGILHHIQGINITLSAANQIKLIDDDQVNAGLRLPLCTTLTAACFLPRAAVPFLIVETLCIPICSLCGTIGAISTPDNSILQSSTLSQIPTLM